jgi:hypothetical protein
MLKRLAAEFTGTFALVFVGTGSIIINDLSGGRVTRFSGSLDLSDGACHRSGILCPGLPLDPTSWMSLRRAGECLLISDEREK